MKTILAIALGGALGAVMRHLLNTGLSAWLKTPFPWGILCVNVLGSFLMGVLVASFAGLWPAPQPVRLFLAVGVLGGFTTFSSFSLDTMALITLGDLKGAAAYVIGSVTLSIAAIFLGSFLIWKIAP